MLDWFVVADTGEDYICLGNCFLHGGCNHRVRVLGVEVVGASDVAAVDYHWFVGGSLRSEVLGYSLGSC